MSWAEGAEYEEVRYEDQATGRVVIAGIPRLTTGAIAPGQSFPLEAEATLDLTALARERSYYGFLAADELNLAYNICPLEADIPPRWPR